MYTQSCAVLPQHPSYEIRLDLEHEGIRISMQGMQGSREKNLNLIFPRPRKRRPWPVPLGAVMQVQG